MAKRSGTSYRISGYLYLLIFTFGGMGIGIYLGHGADETNRRLTELLSGTAASDSVNYTLKYGIIGLLLGLFVGIIISDILKGLADNIDNILYIKYIDNQIDKSNDKINELSTNAESNARLLSSMNKTLFELKTALISNEQSSQESHSDSNNQIPLQQQLPVTDYVNPDSQIRPFRICPECRELQPTLTTECNHCGFGKNNAT